MGFRGTARYELIDKLGEGGMGIVYEAYDRTRQMRVALKTLRNLDADSLYRFKREFRALTTLSHPNIITLFELCAEGESWFLTMELVDGQDFVSYVRGGRSVPVAITVTQPRTEVEDTATATAETRTSTVTLPGAAGAVSYLDTPGLPVPPDMPRAIDEVVDVERLRHALGQLADALHALHSANLVHRDLKPSNVRVTAEGRVVLMDFGVVAEVRRRTQIEHGIFAVGTPKYMAPEQARGQKPSAAADWYAFGVLMYVALTGRLPYEGSRARMLRTKQEHDPLPPSLFTDGIPHDLEELCMALLSRDPLERPTSTQVLARLGITVSDSATSAEFPVMDPASGLFVGRLRELKMLREAFAMVRAGKAMCVFVQGPPGIGKSFLVERFLSELRLLGARMPLVLSGRCQARESLAYKAFDGVIDDLSSYLMSVPEARRREFLPASTSLVAQLFPALRWMSTDESQAPDDHNPIQQRAAALAALRDLIQAIGDERPVVIHTEDIQWADRDSLDLLMDLVRPPAPARLLILATLRIDDLDSTDSRMLLTHVLETLHAEIDCRHINVSPLTEAEQRELMIKMAALPEYSGVSQFLGDPLWRESAGNPMLLAELARSTQEAPDHASTEGELHLEDVIWSRFTRLDERARALMECVALAGEPMPLHVLARASSLSNIDSERASAVLLVGHLARISRTDHEPWLVVYHGKVREAICERLPGERLAAVHGQLADVLETWDEASMASIADHWLAAGNRVKAAMYRYQVARSAAESLAFERAIELYGSALALLPEEAPAGSTTGLPEQAGIRELEITRCRSWIGLAEGMLFMDRSSEARELLDRAQAKAHAYELTADLANIHYLRGRLLFSLGDVEGSLDEHERARSCAEKAGSIELEARALSGLGDAYYLRGHMITAYEHYDLCVALCREQGYGDIEATSLSMRGLTQLFCNDLASALQDSTSAAATAARLGHRRAEALARSCPIPWTLFEMGHIHQARRELEEALELLRGLGMRRFEPFALTHLARILAAKGRRARARALIDESLAICREFDMAFAGPMALGTLALISDEPERRARALDQGQAILAQGAAGHNYLYFYRDAMDAALEAGELDLALHYAEALEAHTRPEPLPWSRFFVDRGRALAAHLLGQGDEALLRGLVSDARKASLHTAAHALEQALASIENAKK